MVVVVATVQGIGSSGVARARKAPSRPNVIVIVTDDQPVGTESALRRSLRWLRKGGTDFPNAYVAIPQCCPSRASIMTGQYPHNHGVLDTKRALDLDHESTLQRHLQDAGFRTGFFGKFLNSWPVETSPPYFDNWALHSRATYRGGMWNVDGTVREVRRYSTKFISREARDFIAEGESNDERPWLLYLAPDAPHAPYLVERKYEEARVARWRPSPAVFENDPDVDPTLDDDKPAYLRQAHSPAERGRNIRRSQLRTLMSVEDMILHLRKTLRRTDENRDTLIVFTSDNGFSWAEHEWIGKAVPYSASIHVPLVIRWPARGAADHLRSDARLVSNVDVAPTVLAALGLDPPGVDEIDGRSLLDPAWVREHVLVEFFRAERGTVPPWASLRGSTFQYVEYYEGGALPSEREYYDLVGDPWQLVNLLAEPNLAGPALATQVTLAERLQLARRCRGTSGPLACP